MLSDGKSSGSVVGDIAGAGQIINSEVAERLYEDALSSPFRQVGALSTDVLKTFRLFTAPLQLAAAYQDRFAGFCERVRSKVPEADQQEAVPEIAAPVMEAFATTSDTSPLMGMFEELMAKAISKSKADLISPSFVEVIKSLSPLQAKFLEALKTNDQETDLLFDGKRKVIVQVLSYNFDVSGLGGYDHYLTLVQDLVAKRLISVIEERLEEATHYPDVPRTNDVRLVRSKIRLTMYGKWFCNSCIASPATPKKPR